MKTWCLQYEWQILRGDWTLIQSKEEQSFPDTNEKFSIPCCQF